MSFTVPWTGYTIDATASVVSSCSSSADVLRECLRRDVVWVVDSALLMVLTILFGTV